MRRVRSRSFINYFKSKHILYLQSTLRNSIVCLFCHFVIGIYFVNIVKHLVCVRSLEQNKQFSAVTKWQQVDIKLANMRIWHRTDDIIAKHHIIIIHKMLVSPVSVFGVYNLRSTLKTKWTNMKWAIALRTFLFSKL